MLGYFYILYGYAVTLKWLPWWLQGKNIMLKQNHIKWLNVVIVILLWMFSNNICELRHFVSVTRGQALYGVQKYSYCHKITKNLKLSLWHFYWFCVMNPHKMLTVLLTSKICHTQTVPIYHIYLVILWLSAEWVWKPVTFSFCHHFKPGHLLPDSARTLPDPDKWLSTFYHNQDSSMTCLSQSRLFSNCILCFNISNFCYLLCNKKLWGKL